MLVNLSTEAELLVVGAHGTGGFAGLVLGSTSAAVAAHAHCPVIVVRPVAPDYAQGPAAGRVVVGVDGSARSQAALEMGFTIASGRALGLTAVHAWTHPWTESPGGVVPPELDWDEIDREEQVVLAESMAGWREKFPDVDVKTLVVRGHAGQVLVDISRGAALLVLASRGRGGFAGLLLGSVSRAGVHHAQCPVAVVRR